MKRIRISREKCIGCLTCVTACIISHESSDARNRVTIDSETKAAPIFCRHCDNPECAFTCMTGAMKKNPTTGFVEYDKDHCASCYMCVMACPYGTLKYDSVCHREIMKCDMCGLDGNNGSMPLCVEKCPMQAIVLEGVE